MFLSKTRPRKPKPRRPGEPLFPIDYRQKIKEAEEIVNLEIEAAQVGGETRGLPVFVR
jgi:hypothetical protein